MAILTKLTLKSLMQSAQYEGSGISLKINKNELFLVLTLTAIQFSHIVDFVVLMPLGPVLMRVLEITPAQFGLLVSAYNISAGIAGVLYAVVADAFDRKRILIYCFIGFIIGTLFCGLSSSFTTLLTARTIAGAFGGILTSVVYAIITDVVPLERRGRAIGIVMSAFSMASVFGVPIGLLISESYGWQMTFIIIASLSALVLALSIFVVPSLKSHVQEIKVRESLLRMYNLCTNKDYAKAYTLISVNVLSIFMVIPFIAPYATRNVGLSETELKYIYLAGGAFTVLSAYILGRLTDRFSAIKVLTFVIPISVIPVYFGTRIEDVSLTVYLCVSTFFMMFVSGRMIPLITLVSEVSDVKDRGSFMGLLNSLRSFASSLATVIAGFLIVEQDSKLLGYDTVGNISIILGFVTLGLALYVNNILKNRNNESTRTQ